MDISLKESMEQLSYFQQESERKMKNDVAKISHDYEKKQIIIEENLKNANRKSENLAAENSHLKKSLQDKEKLIHHLHIFKSQSQAELKALTEKLNSIEKRNTFLNYEFRVLEKEIEIRNVERKFNRKSIDELQKQHDENLKKVTKLETECQRLRSVLKKRNPGFVNSSENSSKKIDIMIDRLYSMEEENKILKEIIAEKNNELSDMKIMYEFQISELSKEHKSNEIVVSGLDLSHDDEISSSGVWEKRAMLGVGEMSLMDDFVEMEKLAIVSVDNPLDKFHVSSAASNPNPSYLENKSEDFHSHITGQEIVPVTQDHSSFEGSPRDKLHVSSSASNPTLSCLENKSEGSPPNVFTGKELVHVPQNHSSFDDSEPKIQNRDWIQDVLKSVLAENRVSGRGLDNILEDIRIALLYKNNSKSKKDDLTKISKNIEDPSEADQNNLFEDDINDTKFVLQSTENKKDQKFSCTEVIMEDKSNSCKELEATGLDLQLQLDSATPRKETLKYNTDKDEKQMQTDYEIATASAKLAECQETLLNLGKQLKSLTPPKQVALFDPDNHKNLNKASSLLSQMLAEDDAKPNFQKTLEKNKHSAGPLVATKNAQENAGFGGLAIVHSKKQSGNGGFLKKLLSRRKKVSNTNNKTSLTFGIV